MRGAAFQPSTASAVDHRSAGYQRYELRVDHLGLCKPAVLSWNSLGDWPPEQHSSEFTEYVSMFYLGCPTEGCCNGQFQMSHRLGWGFSQSPSIIPNLMIDHSMEWHLNKATYNRLIKQQFKKATTDSTLRSPLDTSFVILLGCLIRLSSERRGLGIQIRWWHKDLWLKTPQSS